MKKMLIVIVSVVSMLLICFSVFAETPRYEVRRAESGVTIDGNIDDIWNIADEVEISKDSVDVQEYGRVWSELNASAKVRFLWDDDFFYALFIVIDNEIKTGGAFWQQDSVGPFLHNPEWPISIKTFVAPGTDNPFFESLGVEPHAGPIGGDVTLVDYIKAAKQITNEGYVMEIAISWEKVTSHIPGIGDEFHLSAILIDADEGSWGQALWTGQGDEPIEAFGIGILAK